MVANPLASGGLQKHRFVVPALSGSSTGGTVYNRELTRALAARGVALDVLDLCQAEAALAAGETGTYWLDTLYLGKVPELAQRLPPGARLGLIAHYLPALVRYGSHTTRNQLSAEEKHALERVSLFLAPSGFMRAALARLSETPRPTLHVEPGRFATGVAPLPPVSDTLRAVVVAHLVPGKGVDRLLSALASSVTPSDRLTLTVIGSSTHDAAHAAACHVFARAPSLRERVTLTGELAPDGVNARLATSDLLLSASNMESFGIALSEARTLGLPIVARIGGNVETLVTAPSGGELVPDAAAVAASCLALARTPTELTARRARAQKQALPPRSWDTAAQDFIAEVTRLDTTRPGAHS